MNRIRRLTGYGYRDGSVARALQGVRQQYIDLIFTGIAGRLAGDCDCSPVPAGTAGALTMAAIPPENA
jgi:hypothetical protein